jgi:hypothetical protein
MRSKSVINKYFIVTCVKYVGFCPMQVTILFTLLA